MITKEYHKASSKEWIGLAVLALPTLLLGLDVTALYLAFPALATDLQPNSTEALWIMDAYGIFIAGFLITMGTLGDRIGRRKLLMIGASAFGVASVMAAYSNSAEILIVARAILGIAGSALMPSTLALISNMFVDPRQRSLAIGIWVTMFALGMAAGPLVGGVLVEYFWWGAAFLIAVPVVSIMLVLAPFFLPEYREPQKGHFDLHSVILSLLALLPVIYGIKHAAKYGFDFISIISIIIGGIFGVVFVNRQLKLDSPLLDMKLFTNRAFSVALSILLIGLVGVGGVMLLVTQYLQMVVGLSPLSAGMWMGPPAFMMFLAAIVSPLIARYVRPGFVVAGSLVLSTVGYLLLTRLETSSSISLVVVGFSLIYLGLGTIASLGTDLVIGSAPIAKAGAASAISETAQELGLAVGVAVLGSLTTTIYRNQIDEYIPSYLSDNIKMSVQDSLWSATSVADSLPLGLFEQAKEAFTFGLNMVNWVGAIVIFILAMLSAIALRHIGAVGKPN
ncbi:MAG: MFS transporter [Pseudozobellia sp.]|nr:MFS transporter [Pseudozobellia sp.]MBG48920.1 MFS transporter [Pseudozobellia sp.]|tara:strand:+ start:2988 stop:4505 length:1518 start_codon:yes stop_codon:yes gene_type:complete